MMKKITIYALLLLSFSSQSQVSAPRSLDVKMGESVYAAAKQKLIEGDLIGRFADCAMRLNATATTNKVDPRELNNKVAEVSAYCANELSFALDFHPKEFASFVKQLDEEGYTESFWLNSRHYQYHQKKLLEHKDTLSAELYAVLSGQGDTEVVTVTCSSACQEEASRLSNDGGMAIVVFSMAAQAGLNTTWGGAVYVHFSTHIEYWDIPMFGNKAYFVREVSPEEAPILTPF